MKIITIKLKRLWKLLFTKEYLIITYDRKDRIPVVEMGGDRDDYYIPWLTVCTRGMTIYARLQSEKRSDEEQMGKAVKIVNDILNNGGNV